MGSPCISAHFGLHTGHCRRARPATESDLSFGERTAHQLGVSLIGVYRMVESGIHFGLPFDDNDFSNLVDYTIGISLIARMQ